MSLTLADATTLRDKAFTAYQAALEGSGYSISSGGTSRAFTRQAIEKLRSDYLFWCDEVSRLNGSTSGNKVRYGKPLKVRK